MSKCIISFNLYNSGMQADQEIPPISQVGKLRLIDTQVLNAIPQSPV
jgi:hypothetical protein